MSKSRVECKNDCTVVIHFDFFFNKFRGNKILLLHIQNAADTQYDINLYSHYWNVWYLLSCRDAILFKFCCEFDKAYSIKGLLHGMEN